MKKKVSGVVSTLWSGRCDLPCEVTQFLSICQGRMSSSILYQSAFHLNKRYAHASPLSPFAKSICIGPVTSITIFASFSLGFFSDLFRRFYLQANNKMRLHSMLWNSISALKQTAGGDQKAQSEGHVTTIYCASKKPVVATTTTTTTCYLKKKRLCQLLKNKFLFIRHLPTRMLCINHINIRQMSQPPPYSIYCNPGLILFFQKNQIVPPLNAM